MTHDAAPLFDRRPNTSTGISMPPANVGPGYGCLSNGTRCCIGQAVNATCSACPASGYGVPSLLYGCTGELMASAGRLMVSAAAWSVLQVIA